MTFGDILLLALGLAMDAAAVSAARGMAVRAIRPRHVWRVAAYFGGAQALMPLLGWYLGAWIGPFLQAFQHWLAFALLAGIGAKMVWEARVPAVDRRATEAAVDRRDQDLFGTRVMFGLAIATSIDALAVGVTLPILGAPLVLSLVTIGVTAAALSVAGLFAGRRFGAVLGRRLDVFGGVVLIGLGVKFLLE